MSIGGLSAGLGDAGCVSWAQVRGMALAHISSSVLASFYQSENLSGGYLHVRCNWMTCLIRILDDYGKLRNLRQSKAHVATVCPS